MILTLLEMRPLSELDWPSLGWVMLLLGLTMACLRVKARFASIAEHGKAAELLAHVIVVYFGLGMLTFGVTAALRATFPVPGGVAWQGPIAVIGGIAAMTIGGCTLAEHVVSIVRERRRVMATAAVPAPQE
jgi:hypothetical protein